jgi:hypothetical protein
LGLSIEGRIFKLPAKDGDDLLIQFFRDGHTLRFVNGKEAVRGEWLVDGPTFQVVEPGRAKLSLLVSKLQRVSGVPADTRLVVRLTLPLSSRTAKTGNPVEAVPISPGIFDGKVLLPQGTIFRGVVEEAHGVFLPCRISGWTVYDDRSKPG